MSFLYIEDYLEFIYTNSEVTLSSPIRLARYDISFIDSVKWQITNKTALTDKQLTLAQLIVIKYTKQLQRRNINVNAEALTRTKLGVREINRDKAIWFDDGKIKLHFPYNEELISRIRHYATHESKGFVKWNKADKVWEMAVTEPNIHWAYVFGKENKFLVADEIEHLITTLLLASAENTLVLRRNNNQVEITGAASSLAEYVAPYIQTNDLDTLVDLSSVLEYEVSPELADEVEQQHGSVFLDLCLHRETEIPATTNLTEVFNWIKVVDRFPLMCIGDDITEEYLRKHFPDSIITYNTFWNAKYFMVSNEHIEDAETIKPKVIITTISMLFGQSKQKLLQDAEKIIWACKKLK